MLLIKIMGEKKERKRSGCELVLFERGSCSMLPDCTADSRCRFLLRPTISATSCPEPDRVFPPQAGEQMGIPLTQQASNESRLSMSESVSEFFDAQEVLLSASSSENEVRTEGGRTNSFSEGKIRKRNAGNASTRAAGLPGSQIKRCCDGRN